MMLRSCRKPPCPAYRVVHRVRRQIEIARQAQSAELQEGLSEEGRIDRPGRRGTRPGSLQPPSRSRGLFEQAEVSEGSHFSAPSGRFQTVRCQKFPRNVRVATCQ